MKTIFGLVICSFFLTSCCQKEEGWSKFDSSKWKPIESGLYGKNYRKKMVFDFVHSHLKVDIFNPSNSTHIKEIIKLIDKPYRIDTLKSSHLQYVYEIEEKFEYDIDPNGGMNLIKTLP